MTEKQHRDLLEIVEDACFEMDLEGRVKFFNTALCRITGRHAPEIRANRFFCWLNVDDGTLLRKRMESMGHVGGTSILSLSLKKPDGEILRIRLSLSPVEDGESRISGFRCVGRDVSREGDSAGHKDGEKPFRPDSEHLGFLRHMAHSMRTPLNAFVGGLHLLAGNGCGSAHRESLGEAAERMQRVLEDMQDYIQMTEGQWLPHGGVFSPEEAASEICTRYRRWSESRNLEFVFKTRSLPPSIQGNAGFFRGSLGKLLDNALRFTERGKIEVFLGCRNIAGSLWLSMEISDTGCGMDEETLALALASPFRMEFQKEHREGLGLGLAFIRLMIEEMGGTLRIRSKPGNGTQVICEMPVKESVEVFSLPLAEEEDGEEELRILLVEDNIINQKITMKLLDTKGHLADLAENGFEALEKVKAQSYDLVLMDIQMPGMDGITATRKIREGFCGDKKKKIPIVAFTAHVSAGDRQACLDAGMEDVLTKPVKPVDLHAMLRKWTRRQPKDL
nr:response regulator [Desulfobotulus pelophilus]